MDRINEEVKVNMYRLISVFAVSAVMALGGGAELTKKGTGTIGGGTAGVESGYQYRQTPQVDAHFNKASGWTKLARVPANFVPRPVSVGVTGAGANFSGFNALSHRDQRLADKGNQFNIEPPDQGLAVGNGFVVEAVNLAIAVYSKSGALVAGPASINQFLGLAPPIVRSSPPAYGPFVTDPRVYYDAPTGHWFLTVLALATDPATGAFGGDSAQFIAVSQTSDPTMGWTVYFFDTADAGNPGCPCFGDQPLIGADANGFYISTNEFSIAGPQFNGAQIYAISKTGIENGTNLRIVHLAPGALADGISNSVQPATTPPGGSYETANGGTEYFLSALDFAAELDDRIAVWALTNTSSLNTNSPSLTLTNVVIGSEVYGQPPAMQQQTGPTPLADLLKGNLLGVTSNEHLELIDSNDDRMQQTVFAAGSLWSALSTVVKTGNGPVRVGVAWFIVTPSWSGGVLNATVTKEGYVSVDQENLAFPSIGVNSSGKGLMTFTLVGPDYYPSAGYTTIDAINGTGATVQIAGTGAGPDDGFTGYGAFGGRAGRWGDYTAAVADADGSVWMGAEYIPSGPRTLLANWGTFLGKIVP